MAKSTFRTVVEIMGGVATVVGALYAVHSYVDNRIEQKIMNPKFIAAVAADVRPAIVFDDKNRILADLGGLRFIEKVRFLPVPNKMGHSVITVTPRAYLPISPLLTSLDMGALEIRPRRGEQLDWVYDLEDKGITARSLESMRFRLEILNVP